MNIFIGITLIILNSQHQQQYTAVNGIKNHQFCNLVEKECIGSYNGNQYEIICQYTKCHPPHVYQCGRYKCSVGKNECEEYLKMNRYTNSVTFKTNVKHSLISEKAMKTIASFDEDFFRFKKNIRNCTSKAYNWKPTHICSVDKYCYQKDEVPGRFNFISKIFSNNKYILRRVNCPCKHSNYPN
jgi:hypothetical protein